MSYNRAYHGFFEGYTELSVLDPKTGKTHIERVYVGSYYRHAVTDSEWKRIRTCYGTSYALSLLCFIIQAFNRSVSNWYTVIPIVLLLIAMIWCGFYVCAYISHDRNLKIRQYRESQILQGTAAACAAGFALGFLGQGMWFILNRLFYGYGLLCLAADAAGALLMYRMFMRERNMEYEKVSNRTEAPDNSYDIRFNNNEEDMK